MSTNDVEITKLHRVRKTLMQMLNDRGYLVTDDEINMTKEQFIEHYGENVSRTDLNMLTKKQDDSSDKIMVVFGVPEESKQNIGIKAIRDCVERMASEKVFRAILVVERALTPSAKKQATEMPTLRMELFQDSELICNVTEHDLVPEHQVLSDDEKKAVLEKYRVKETQLPRMLVTDPVARYFGLYRGQVVKVFRPSENAGRYVTYRYVS